MGEEETTSGEQFLTGLNLDYIKSLINYLNGTFDRNSDLSADVTLTDSNGEAVGEVKIIPGNDERYVFTYPAPPEA